MMNNYIELPVEAIELDKSNPRIARGVAYYGENITSETMALLLGSTSEACASLRESIRENGGIIHPIVVNRHVDGSYVVVEGNTRLQIYKDFGNSKKASDLDRGFRGIGRLAALGYCSKLIFETSAASEDIGTRIVIDSNKLSRLLTAKDDNDVTITEVLDQIYFVEQYPESITSHYFKVVLDEVDDTSGLNDYENVFVFDVEMCWAVELTG